jgi:radical SAM protein with 4Fe4S-binding SPASM domain
MLVPTALADLVMRAARLNESFFDAYYATSGDSPYDESDAVRYALDLKNARVLDDDMRVIARLTDGRRGGRALSAPLLTHIQLTRACNLRCTHCFVDIMAKPDPHELSTTQMLALFHELAQAGAPVVVLGGGEPMLRRDFWELVDGVRDAGLFASLCTNGTLVSEEAARRLASSSIREYSISIDGPDEESHARMRGPGRFEQAVTAIRRLRDAGVPEVQIRVTVTRTNVERLIDFVDVATRSGAHKIAFKPFRRTETGAAFENAALDVDRLTYMRAIERARAVWPSSAPPAEWDDGVPERTPDWTEIIPAFGCVGGTTSASVMYDGRVVGCGFVLDPRDWSLHAHSLLECWHDAPTVHAWRTLDGNDGCKSECDNFSSCGGGCRARAIGSGRTMRDKDPWADCVLPDVEKPHKRAHLPILA